jgi:hypothetical protein
MVPKVCVGAGPAGELFGVAENLAGRAGFYTH